MAGQFCPAIRLYGQDPLDGKLSPAPMSASRWVISALIVLHLMALTVGLIPNPDELNSVGPVRYNTDGGWLSAHLTPLFDRLALVVAQAEPSVFAATRPIAPIARTYLRNGLAQQFRMFSNPVRTDMYVRIVYFVAARTGESRGYARELVLPMDREDQMRWTLEYRDKAILNSMAAFSMDVAAASSDAPHQDPAARERSRASALAPVVRYFRQRFEADHVRSDERVVRTELWIGEAPNPPMNAPSDAASLRERLALLDTYRIQDVRRQSTGYVPAGTQQLEADIVWTLARIE